MGHQFDDFFKKKMDQRSVEFKEDHWKAMEQLLDDDKPSKKGGFYFWLFGLLGLMCLTAGWFIYQNYYTTNKTTITQDALNTSSITSGNNTKKAAAKKLNNDNQLESNKNNTTNNNNQNESDEISNNSQSTTKNNNKKGLDDFDANAKNKLQKTDINTRAGDAEGVGNQLDGLPAQTNLNTDLLDDNTNIQVPTTPNPNTELVPVAEVELTTDEEPTIETSEIQAAINAIESLELFVEGEGKRKSIPKCPYDTTPEFNFGLSAAVVQVPSYQGNLQLWGTTLGAHVQLKRNDKSLFSLNSGVAYTYLQGDFDYTQESLQIEYRFGKEQSAYRLMPRSLHFIEIPLTLKFQLARNSVDAGINISYLTGVRADVVLDGRFEDAGWIDKQGFNEFRTDLTLGYAWRMTNNWDLIFSAQYALKNIVDAAHEPVEGKSFDAVNPLQFRFGIKWNLK